MAEPKLTVFLKAIVAGVYIGFGGTAFLAIDNKIVGSLFFSLGLLAICVNNKYLFTGKICYLTDVKNLLIVLLGNYVGATLFGFCIRAFRPVLAEKSDKICAMKLNEGLDVIFLGLVCNIFVYLAIEAYNSMKAMNMIGLSLFISAFIICGFEHSIANMFYFSSSNIYYLASFSYILMNVFGNILGGIFIQLTRRAINRTRRE